MNSSLSKVDLNKRKKALFDKKDKSPILQLKVINANSSIKKGTVLTITCLGLENGINNRKDGFVYFGYFPHNMSIPTDDNNNNVIDFNLDITPSSEANTLPDTDNSTNVGRHFLIEYLLEKNKYIIKDLGIGYGTFFRLNYIHTLKDNQLINIGTIYIVVNIGDKLENTDGNGNSHFNSYSQNNSIASAKVNQLKLRVYGVNNDGDTFYFMPQNHNISIGRYELADVKLNDKLLSSIHCVINYSEKEGWKLMDGQSNKPSTNGTWIYINEEYEIYDQMIFKTNQTIFQASILNKDKQTVDKE